MNSPRSRLSTKWLYRISNHPIIAVLIIIGTIVAALAGFTDSLERISKFWFPAQKYTDSQQDLNDGSDAEDSEKLYTFAQLQNRTEETIKFEQLMDNDGNWEKEEIRPNGIFNFHQSGSPTEIIIRFNIKLVGSEELKAYTLTSISRTGRRPTKEEENSILWNYFDFATNGDLGLFSGYGIVDGNCFATPSTAKRGGLVVFHVSPTKGNGWYDYLWTGTDDLNGTTPNLTKRYTTLGLKRATVKINSDYHSVTRECYVKIIK